jgi:RNA polymerase-binding transcription factor DksA
MTNTGITGGANVVATKKETKDNFLASDWPCDWKEILLKQLTKDDQELIRDISKYEETKAKIAEQKADCFDVMERSELEQQASYTEYWILRCKKKQSDVRQTIKKIGSGKFDGVCSICQGKMPWEKILETPWATKCVCCKTSAHEKNPVSNHADRSRRRGVSAGSF